MSIKEHFVNTPEELEALGTQIDGEEDKSITHYIRLAIFYPLAHKDMLDRCRDPDSRYSRDPAGNRCGLTDHEYLDITPLGKAWRQYWKVLPTKISHIAFDMTLPIPDEGVEQVRWDNKHVETAGIKMFVPQHGVKLVIDTLVLEMHMRSKGKVKMDLTWEPRADKPVVGMIQSYIEALATNGKSHQEKSLKERSRS